VRRNDLYHNILDTSALVISGFICGGYYRKSTDLQFFLIEIEVVRVPVDKKPGSLLALTPLSVAVEMKITADTVHVIVIPELIHIIQYPCTIRNRYTSGLYMVKKMDSSGCRFVN